MRVNEQHLYIYNAVSIIVYFCPILQGSNWEKQALCLEWNHLTMSYP